MRRVWGLLLAARAMTRAEWRELAEAQLALIIAQALVWSRPVGRLITPSAPASPFVPWGPCEKLAAERLASALNRAARYGILRPQCLVRALALTRLLQSRGIAGSSIRIGVRWDPDAGDGAFAAHAWVVGGEEEAVVGDSTSNTAPFSELATVHAAGGWRSVPR